MISGVFIYIILFFHLFCAANSLFLLAVRNPAAGQVVGRHFQLHAVSQQNADVIAPHLPGEVSQNLMAVIQLDLELSCRQRLNHSAFHLDLFFFSH